MITRQSTITEHVEPGGHYAPAGIEIVVCLVLLRVSVAFHDDFVWTAQGEVVVRNAHTVIEYEGVFLCS